MIYNVFGSLAMFASRLDGNQRNEQRKGKVGGSSLKRLRRQEEAAVLRGVGFRVAFAAVTMHGGWRMRVRVVQVLQLCKQVCSSSGS